MVNIKCSSCIGYNFIYYSLSVFLTNLKFFYFYCIFNFRGPAGYDRTRNAVIGNKDFDLSYLEEAYTTEHWLVRIYRVKKPEEFNRPAIKSNNRTVTSTNFVTRKVNKILV